MGKANRANVLNDETEAAIKKLGKLTAQAQELREQLEAIEAKKDDVETALAQALDEGTYRVNSWICKVADKFVKGRVSPSWKSIAETDLGNIDIVKKDLIDRYPDSETPLRKMAEKLHTMHENAVELNTKVGEDKVETKVTVEHLTDHNG